MFVALRDLRHARGRFLLVTGVVALLAMLVGLLSGLTGGLAQQNISAMVALPADRVVVAAADGGEPGYASSVLTSDQAASWSRAEGVTSVAPLGISQLRAASAAHQVGVAVLGADVALDGPAPAAGTVAVSAPAAKDLDVAVGDTVRVAGRPFTVARIAGDDWYSHTPVIYTSVADWLALAEATGTTAAAGSGAAGGAPYATALLVRGSADWGALEASTATTSRAVLPALVLLPAFRSEIGSLGLIIALLFGISALVVGAFFTVWTVQRKADIAVLKALGAQDSALRRDALGQAAVVLAVGIGAAMVVVVGAGLAAHGVMPFLLSPLTTVLPAVLMAVVGLAGAALAVRSVAAAEPLTALGSNR